jgi:hypothetical protein
MAMGDREKIIEELTQEFRSCCKELLDAEVPNEMGLDTIEKRTEEVVRRIGSTLIEKQISQLGTGKERNRRETPDGEIGVFKGIKKKR